jgi:hypothetical protein
MYLNNCLSFSFPFSSLSFSLVVAEDDLPRADSQSKIPKHFVGKSGNSSDVEILNIFHENFAKQINETFDGVNSVRKR